MRARSRLQPSTGISARRSITVNIWERQRAVALALLGRNEEALQALENGHAGGYRTRWWYLLEREAAFAQVRSDPRFQALLVEARAHAASQRSILKEMRLAGRVPNRSPT